MRDSQDQDLYDLENQDLAHLCIYSSYKTIYIADKTMCIRFNEGEICYTSDGNPYEEERNLQ